MVRVGVPGLQCDAVLYKQETFKHKDTTVNSYFESACESRYCRNE